MPPPEDRFAVAVPDAEATASAVPGPPPAQDDPAGRVPAPAAKPGVRDAVVAFQYRNFALFWSGALLSSTGN